MAEVLRLFQQRANKFFKEAQRYLNEKDFELAAFFAEQAAQLLLKTYLLERTGTFPHTHNLHILFKEAGKIDPFWLSFHKENISVVDDLYQAYFTSRYLPFEFEEEAVEAMISFLKHLKQKIDET